MTAKPTQRVLIIESGEGVGGSAFSMYRIVKYLDKTRYEPHVFVYHRTAVFKEIEKLGVPVTVLPLYPSVQKSAQDDSSFVGRLRGYTSVYGSLLKETLLNGFRLARFIRRTGIDVVHCNNGFFENFAAAFAARITGTTCVAHVRGTEPLMKIERLCGGWVRRFIVLNKEMYDLYSEAFGTEKVRLVFNGVDLDEFDNPDPTRIRKEFDISPDKFCVGTFARLVEGKGIPEFLKAAAIVSKSQENLTFFIAGGGSEDGDPYVEHLHALADSLEIGNRVIFAGWRDDAKDCMSAMDLVLQISTTFPEGMSLAPIEAMTLSKPVIVTDNPGYWNVVEDGKSGYIVKAGDVDTLARLVERIVVNKELAHDLGRNARRRVLEEFDYRIVVERVQSVYVEAALG